ncbi:MULTISPECIES: putative T6SS immunity periplasmic lipoprotein [Leclercia]|uniref:putative T6SS immunity periplasmic lipoprotein n=1 Tax=Leclercia TaxID=83654 RepID=UPI001331BBEA|nr:MULTISPECIES: putative T6SS immunity periplasmic lipoprotein [Leclercia]
MKNLLLIALILILTGCPGKGKEGAQYGERRAIHIESNRVCFTLNENDVLDSYSLSPNHDAFNKLLRNYSTHLKYPDTCFNVNFEKAVVYGTRYTLNQKMYYYTFLIDKDGQIIDLGDSAVCPYPTNAS